MRQRGRAGALFTLHGCKILIRLHPSTVFPRAT